MTEPSTEDRLREIYNYRRLSARIATAGQPTEEELRLVAQAGFQTVIDLALLDAEYSLPDEPGLVAALGMGFVHIPVIWEAPALSDLECFFDAMYQYREARLFIHCAANKRVSAFMALYRIIRRGWEPAAAYADMNAIWEPNPVWRRFMDQALALQGLGGPLTT